MLIKRNEKINNIPLIKIRDYFKTIYGIEVSKMHMKNHFNLNTNGINSLIEELLRNDFIEKNIGEPNKSEYQLTAKGQALCLAHSVPPLNKIKADKIFNEFMKRVEEINNSDYYLYKVKKLLLFGSYLISSNEHFGDIDIACELIRKTDNPEEYKKAAKKRIQEMEQKGKYFSNYMEEAFYFEKEVILKLKNRCQYISLYSIDDEVLKTAKFKQIYPIKSEKL
ncbi:MAG: hypothetical protein LBD84_03580 [Campylobacteraceae bacterium]|jgi:predicted transcriptional regulator/predicted nucleotidyltransferase|nr:hypothetical protein [Campylobacteraceae bacterium]